MFAPNFGGSLMRGHKGHPNLVGNICDFNLKKYVRCVLGFPFFHTQTLTGYAFFLPLNLCFMLSSSFRIKERYGKIRYLLALNS